VKKYLSFLTRDKGISTWNVRRFGAGGWGGVGLG
jgi:hypothetical protein